MFLVLTLSVAIARPAPFQLGAEALMRWEHKLVEFGSSGLADLSALEEKVVFLPSVSHLEPFNSQDASSCECPN